MPTPDLKNQVVVMQHLQATTGEKGMSIRDAQHKLRILYGLSQNEPTPNQISKWRERARVLMNPGLSSDDAGDRASQEIFTTDMMHFYAAQPDTIHDILNDIDKD